MQVGIADARGEEWRQLKRLAARPFSLLNIKKNIPMFNKGFKDMVDYLELQAKSDVAVDGTEFIKKLAINMIAYIGFGLEVNSYKDANSEFRKQANQMVEVWRFLLITLICPVACFFKLSSWNPESVKFYEMIGKKAVEARKMGKEGGKDILGALIKMSEEEPDVMTPEMLKFTLLNLIVDGYNTIADVATNLFYLLAVNPEVQTKLQSEIDEVFDAKDDGMYIN